MVSGVSGKLVGLCGVVSLLVACVEPPTTSPVKDQGNDHDMMVQDSSPDLDSASDMMDVGVTADMSPDLTSEDLDMDESDASDQAAFAECDDVGSLPEGMLDGSTPEKAYLICSVAELEELRNGSQGKYYRLGRSLDMSDWTTSIPCFEGHLDGGNYTLSNLNLSTLDVNRDNRGCVSDEGNVSNAYGVLFNEVKGGTIKSIKLDGIVVGNDMTTIQVSDNLRWLSGVIGRAEDTTLEDIEVSNITAYVKRWYAHVVAEAIDSEFTNIRVKNSVMLNVGGGYVGGILSQGRGVSLSRIYVQGAIDSLKSPKFNHQKTGLIAGFIEVNEADGKPFTLQQFVVDGTITIQDNLAESDAPIAYEQVGLVIGDLEVSGTTSALISQGLVQGGMTLEVVATEIVRDPSVVIGMVVSASPELVTIEDIALHDLEVESGFKTYFLANTDSGSPSLSVSRVHIKNSTLNTAFYEDENQPETMAYPVSSPSTVLVDVCVQNSSWPCGVEASCRADVASHCAVNPLGFSTPWVDVGSDNMLPQALKGFLDALEIDPFAEP